VIGVAAVFLVFDAHNTSTESFGHLDRGNSASPAANKSFAAHNGWDFSVFGLTMLAISSHSLAILRNSFLSTGEELFAADRRALAASPRKRFIRCSGVSESPDTPNLKIALAE
jgi:hypothetical protein